MVLVSFRGLHIVGIYACLRNKRSSFLRSSRSFISTNNLLKENILVNSIRTFTSAVRTAASSSSSNSSSDSSLLTENASNYFLKRLVASPHQIIPQDTVESEMHHSTNFTNDDKFVVCVEGNIGCGKTTLLSYFEEVGDCEVIAEPVEKWRSVGGHNPLQMMYNDPKRWSLALQTYIQLSMLQIHTQPLSHKVRLMERSIFSAKYCFVDNLFNSGLMHEMEYIILSKWFDWIVESHKVKVDLIVYLRTDPVQLHERIMKRCRKEEKDISLEYLQTLHNLHDDWLIHKRNPCAADVLVLDANTSLEHMKLVYEQHKSNILNARLQEAQSQSV